MGAVRSSRWWTVTCVLGAGGCLGGEVLESGGGEPIVNGTPTTEWPGVGMLTTARVFELPATREMVMVPLPETCTATLIGPPQRSWFL